MDNNKITKHLGRIQATGQRVIVLFKRVPNEDGTCLVVEYDRLPDMYKDNLLTILHQAESQASDEFQKVLQNRLFGDGEPILLTLHKHGHIKKYPHSDVTLVLNNATNLKMSELIAYENTQINTEAQVEQAVNTAIIEETHDKAFAESLLVQAKQLEKQADALKERAYVICEDLRPSRGRPSLTSEERKQKRKERNRVRREKYHQDKVTASLP